nr:MAG TPA: hypothetical protein [Herelleviridae sp.]
MAEFHEIGSSQFTETTSPTGEEMIQISATQKVKLKTIITALIKLGLGTTSTTAYGGNEGLINRTILESFGLTTVSGVNTNLTRTATQNKLAFKSRSRKDKTNAFGDEAENLNVFFEVATQALAGLMSAADKVKLDGSILGSALVVAATALAAGTAPTVKWDNSSNTLTFGIPKGDKGDKGDAGSSSSTDMKMTGWTNITKYGDVQDPYIQASDTLLDAIRKLSWMTGNNTVKTLGDSSGIGMIWWNGDTQNDLFTAFYLMIETREIYFIFEGTFSDLGDQATEDQIIGYIINKGNAVYIGTTRLINYVSGTNVVRNLGGKESLWYTGSSNPTLTLLEHTFNDLAPTASLICAYNITPTFSKQNNSTSVIHMHQNAADVAPTSGYKVYTILCQVVGSVKHFFINVAPYN